MEGLEAAVGGAFALDHEGGDRLCEALDPGRTEVGQLEQTADQPPGRLADDDAAGRGQRLQPGGKVRRLADHGALLRLALADRLADHHEAGRDPDPGSEFDGRPPQARPRFRRERGPPAPPARRRPHAPAASRNRPARRRP